jgi:hypothetical protein
MIRGLLVRLAFAALLSLLLTGPVLAGGTSTINVGLVVTGAFASPLTGSWHSPTAARGSIYHFTVSGHSGAFYRLVSVPLRDAKGTCDLRVSGVIYSLEQTSKRPSYEMQYSVRSADVVASSAQRDACKDVAASYLSDMPAVESLVLSGAGEGRLVDRSTGAEYIRAH